MRAVRTLIADLTPLELRGKVTLVPVVNEPALHRGQRCGDDALDLARSCPGRPDGTITEQIAHALTRLIRSADHYIDLHSGGTSMRVLPLVGYMLHPDAAVLDMQRRMARAFNLPILWGTDARLEGRSLSAARDAGVPAIYAEYLGGDADDLAGVRALVEGCLNVMGELRMIARDPAPRAVEHAIEDPRPNSGHMQVCYPSPIAGFFEPAARLGDHIRAGTLVGTVADALGEQVQAIYSRQSGLVLVLHTCANVSAGESLAVILELDPALVAPLPSNVR